MPGKFAVGFADTPLGTIRIVASEHGITRCEFVGGRSEITPKSETHEAQHLERCASELYRYFRRELREFTVPIDVQGTPFQRSVWEITASIPWGETRTYRQIAAILGSIQRARAVGAANARNPVCIIIPCHRIIGSAGELTGFAGGIERKKALLDLERTHTPQSPAASRHPLTKAESFRWK